jgi:uncharacterized protein
MESLPIMYSAAALGLLGSFHCLGMCGPLALAIPGDNPGRAFFYHLGRVLTYSILGLFSGVMGDLLRIAGFQQWMSILSGILILIIVWLPTQYFSFLSTPVYRWIGEVSGKSGFFMMFLSGMANGLLPCGLVYVAMAGSLSTDSALGSALYMTTFGLGTLPMLLLLAFAGKILPVSSRSFFRKSIPYAASLVACLLIVRGMNLGIPYLSPKIDKGQAECCKVK